MNCPNCSQTFILLYDYARHLQGCLPHDESGAGAQHPTAIRRPAADVPFDEIDLDAPSLFDERASTTALAGERR